MAEAREGWIKLHRSLLNWEWWDDMNVTRLWIYILLRANHDDKKWHGDTVEKGTFITSYGSMSKDTGLTVDEIRTALLKLERSKNITRKSTNKYQAVTVVGWEVYQLADEKNPKQIPNKSQTIPKPFPTNKNIKNERIKEIYLYIVEHLNQKAGTDYKPTTKKTQECIRARLAEGFTEQDFVTVIDKKCAEWRNDPKMCRYLRPETLFGNKFEGYLNQVAAETVKPLPAEDSYQHIHNMDFADMERRALERRVHNER